MIRYFYQMALRRHRATLPRNPHLRRDIGISERDCVDEFLARHNPNLGGWV